MSGLTILLAEDNEKQALLITRALQKNKSVKKVIHFQDGQETLNYLFLPSNPGKSGDKCILLLDIQMPCVNGIEVLKKIKNHDDWKSLPVIMFSSISDPQIMDLCYQYGCNAFIHKPADQKEFEQLSMLDLISIMQVPAVPFDILSQHASGDIL